ncbi:tetraketide alpha-pyrone reductase 1-like isoform X2 [Chenopodium quinoa]|uniref:tetraketide alpha-pyrone reductase 1-like isoform X2 n=1 Tax=Chenopodium quinoa TaxID=63459 RepID=UPI000B778478|nr:tetraketide alpha-pyrone reductase 1-like isoform X2 [Chenopodium quinoa]
MDEIAKEKKVCVTGASGYIASWLVKLLLQRGYTVNATVRNPNDSDKTEHLLKLEGAKERLHFFKANLIEEGSFDSAIVGCEGVFHTASPVVFSPKDPQVDLLDPAIKGTLNILASCKKFPAVRRVVLTSSMATSTFTSRPLTPDVVVDETWFSDPELCKGSDMMYYVLSKVLAEEAAWKYAKENDIDMVSINPSMVIGPMLKPTINDSVASILNLINDLACPWVHVKDVAEAHIRAFEIPSAKGRYNLGGRVLHFSDVKKILHELYPSIKLPNKCVDVGDALPKTIYQLSNVKVKSLGIIEYIPFEVSLKETVENLKELKFV